MPFVILFVYATALAPFLDASFRNYLLIAVSALCVPLVFSRKFRFGLELPAQAIAVLYSSCVTIYFTGSRDFSTIANTSMFAFGYLAMAAFLQNKVVTPSRMRAFLGWLIKLFAIVAIIQLLTSMAGLPVLNQLATRGLWNYNSLATEPSNVGRIISLCMLVYILLSRFENGKRGFVELVRAQKWVFLAYVSVIFLSGSTLAIAAAPLAILLAFRPRWALVFLGLMVLAWPVLREIDNAVLQRLFLFIKSAETLDINQMAKQDTSASIRVAPLIIWLDTLDTQGSDFWFGGGLDSLEFFVGRIPGVAEGVMVGFLPGYWMAFGFFGTMLFLWAFVFRFLNAQTLPVVAMLTVFFSTAGWNTQVFWFGLMLLRVCHTFSRSRSQMPLTEDVARATKSDQARPRPVTGSLT